MDFDVNCAHGQRGRCPFHSTPYRFRPLHLGSGKVDVSVVLGGSILFQREIVRDGRTLAAPQTFAFAKRPLKAGQQLEWVVGAGLTESSNACDGTAIRIRLSSGDE